MRRIRLFGHPLHPATVHLPFGLLAAVPVLDGFARLAGRPEAEVAARLVLDLGLLAAIPALVTGLLDFVTIPTGHPSAGSATIHVTAMASALAMAAFARVVWVGSPDLALGLAVGTLLALILGGWAGGNLVYVHGVATRDEE